MEFAPNDLFEKLEFDKIILIVESLCLGEPGSEYFKNLKLSNLPHVLERQLQEVFEYKKTFSENHQFPGTAYFDISEDLKMLSIEGFVLSVDSLRNIAQILHGTQKFYRFFNPKSENRALYPNLFNIIRETDFDEALLVSINRVVDDEGNIRPDASPELQRIARMQASKRQELDKRFRQVANFYNSKNQLADTVESFRNGRRVLAVLAEYKRQVKGILHDESATGKTVFIEPEEVIDLNNDLFDLEQEYRREIYKILRDLSTVLRPYCSHLRSYLEITIRFDVIQAKGQLAYTMDATKPKLFTKPHFKIHRAFHPLLYLKNKRGKQRTVPFDLRFKEDTRILVLSGPNAGGKSICMKAIGLFQLMTQAGMLIPVEEGSEIGIFDKFFADIGDQQSLEDELSTYSSRLQNAKYFLDNADDKTLVLIDEFGSGTDPKMGGAIAESILRELNYKKSFAVITTHYSNLKTFAFENKGLVNGHMVFDMNSLSPTYEMRVGKPGSSYAFEIAAKSGLNEKVINYAKKQIGHKEQNFDEMIIELQRERQKLTEAQLLIADQQKQLDQLIKNYEFAQKELEFGRKKLKLQIKELELLDLQKTHKDLQKVLREMREEDNRVKAMEKAQQIIEKTKVEQQELSETIEVIKEDIYKVYEEKEHGIIEEGSTVRMRNGGMIGTVKEIKKKEAIVEMEHITITVKMRDLILVSNPLEINKGDKIKTSILQKQSVFDTKIDIRGMRYEDALQTLQEFLDNALLSNVHEVRIIHGKGFGVLRKAVQVKLKEYPNIKDIRYAEANQGGDGQTVVEFG
jgi:DNA mismatch repair protein MutS2